MALDSFFHNKIESMKLEIIQGQAVLRRLEAQRNDYNSRGRGTVVDIADSVDITKLVVGKRVTLLSDSYKLEKMLPSSVDPLVSLMMVEKVPDSTYDMIGGLDQQIKEIKEVIELGLKHPELFESLGIAQPKGSSRVEGSSGGDSEVQRTMLELLNQLDGFEPTKNIKVIMATNRLDILDPALLRPGRIDRKIEFPPPTVEARADILRIHSRSMNLTRGINLTKVAEKMNGCSGAELKGVCTEAGMYALRERRVHVTQEDFDLATAKVLNKHDDKETSIAKLWK
ncbi:putative 26S protease regulatory subunit 8 like protein [Glarea lozoyensis 74030]|uniref:Putative 26S protease regulatory subunit 8 like protein n=1 Tax=Glarea lozoyensis (strain ATCC 74030 / MF5533) TaxID=1104152 RepID=H0ELL9_GLAL7|nr:putative 26S protease regulatory subunit 8 like protein [Glarea lozoyensis 74030]